ncbi:MAG: extracellular solute-binding protein, partial [Clostridiales bacterium]|nr:extracellular solute-binding protein [Clostridiales bacterium]
MKLLKGKRILILILALCLLCVCAVVMTGCGQKDRNEVRIYSYGDYIAPGLIKEFEKETGINVIYDTFDTNEEMYPVIKNQAGVYDVI